MALEAMEQVLQELSSALASIDTNAVDKLEQLIVSANEIFCYGLGRSGLCCRGFAMRLMHLGLASSIVGDILAHPMNQNGLLIVTSASGTGVTLEMQARKAKKLGAKVALITSNGSAAIAAFADVMVTIQAPTKRDTESKRTSIMPMGSLFEETAGLLFDLIVVDLMKRMNINNEDMVSRHANLE